MQQARAAMEGGVNKKKGSGGFVQFFFLVSVVLCVSLYAPRVFVHISYHTDAFFAVDNNHPAASISRAGRNNPDQEGDGGNNIAGDGDDDGGLHNPVVLDNQVGSPCSTMRNDSICCDRSDFNTDVCFMTGDVRTDAASLSLLLFPPPTPQNQQQEQPAANVTAAEPKEEWIRPYTRKWEPHIMRRIQEVRLRRVARPEEEEHHGRCDVRHDAPLLVMTAGGYTGNFFHAFSDGFLPVWLTTQHLRRRVVLGVLSYRPWWATRFGQIISGLSGYDVIDLLKDKRTHCFPGAIVGTRFHGILKVDPARLRDNKTIVDFHHFLASVLDETADGKKAEEKEEEEEEEEQPHPPPARRRGRPRLGIVSRKGTRVIENEAALARLATSVGFDVAILGTANVVPLSREYAAASACDALVGVHGADLTKFLFLRPGRASSSLTQIAPLGLSRIARDCFGTPAARMGVAYEQYEVRGRESSLSRKYPMDDVVVADPETATRTLGGWKFVDKVYLRGQNVSLDLHRFRETLVRMHARALLSRRLPAEQR